jgi:glycosyltransferase involved in cell wall biosynthesis
MERAKYFIEAFKMLAPAYPDLHGLIIGDGAGRTWITWRLSRRTVDDAGLGNRVRFLG